MGRYQTESHRASGASSGSASACVSAGSSNLCAFSRASPPLPGPKESARKLATRRTAGREDRPIRTAARNASESRTDAIALVRAGVASIAMPDVHFYTADVTSSDWIAAGASIAVAIVIAIIVDRVFQKSAASVQGLAKRDELSPATRTRLGLPPRLNKSRQPTICI